MEEQLSLWTLVAEASIVVQLVMLALLLASVVSWTMIISRLFYYRSAERSLADFETQFWSGIDLGKLYRQANANAQEFDSVIGVENIFRSGFKEFSRLRQQVSTDADAIMQGAHRGMRVALAREEEKLDKNLPFLATVGSTSPYVGLFGTVWGIMQAFRGLANMQQATIASVAPGISEALIATAMGLFAAIPAVIAYNRFSARGETLVGRYEQFSDEFSSILHRQAYSNASAKSNTGAGQADGRGV